MRWLTCFSRLDAATQQELREEQPMVDKLLRSRKVRRLLSDCEAKERAREEAEASLDLRVGDSVFLMKAQYKLPLHAVLEVVGVSEDDGDVVPYECRHAPSGRKVWLAKDDLQLSIASKRFAEKAEL